MNPSAAALPSNYEQDTISTPEISDSPNSAIVT
jgi:hypothetical protein